LDVFKLWIKEAIDSGVNEPTAMTLSTASNSGYPSSRVVLLKGYNKTGLVFFTNYESKKGKQLISNPNCAVNFFWPELERQIRIEGVARITSEEVSEEYFNSRPEESKISAIISPQSKVVPDREYLENLRDRFNYSKNVLCRPKNWGGFEIIPESIEFWQGRPGRLHDRILFSRNRDGWKKERLAP